MHGVTDALVSQRPIHERAHQPLRILRMHGGAPCIDHRGQPSGTTQAPFLENGKLTQNLRNLQGMFEDAVRWRFTEPTNRDVLCITALRCALLSMSVHGSRLIDDCVPRFSNTIFPVQSS